MQYFLGVIIDKFGSLREEESQKQRDIDGFCFICGHSKFNLIHSFYIYLLLEKHSIELMIIKEVSSTI